MVTLALRPARPEDTLRVALDLDGRPADLVTVPGDHWTVQRFSLPPTNSGARFRRLDIRIPDALSATNVLFVGKVEPR